MKKRLFMVLAVLALTVCLLPMVVGAEETCEHVRNGGVILNNADPCEQPTMVKYSCMLCGDELSTEVKYPAKGHKENGGTILNNDDPCEKDTMIRYNCTVCGDETRTEVKYAAKGHTPNGGTVLNNDDPCEQPTMVRYNCTVCGDVTSTEVKYPAKGHKENGGTVLNNDDPCEKDTMVRYNCTVCGDETRTEVKYPAKGHKEGGAIAYYPTCTTDGYKAYNCTVCGDLIRTEAWGGTAYGHSKPANYQHDENGHWYTCTNTNKAGEVCGATVGAAAHNYTGWSCTTNGTCICGAVKEASHTTTNVAAVAPECEKAGSTAGVKCTKCDYTTVEPVKATGHNWNDGVIVKEATYTETGLIRYTCLNNRKHVFEEATAVLKEAYDPNLDRVPKTGCVVVEWLYALIGA